MNLVRELAESGRKIRVEHKRRQRLPCAQGWIVSGPDLSEYHEILAEELNVEAIGLEPDLNRFQKTEVHPNRRKLGAKCRQDLPKVISAFDELDHETLWSELQNGTVKIEGYEVSLEDVE